MNWASHWKWLQLTLPLINESPTITTTSPTIMNRQGLAQAILIDIHCLARYYQSRGEGETTNHRSDAPDEEIDGKERRGVFSPPPEQGCYDDIHSIDGEQTGFHRIDRKGREVRGEERETSSQMNRKSHDLKLLMLG